MSVPQQKLDKASMMPIKNVFLIASFILLIISGKKIIFYSVFRFCTRVHNKGIHIFYICKI